MFLKSHPSDPSELIIILLPGMSLIDHPEIIDHIPRDHPVCSIAAQLFANKPNRVCIQHGYVYLIGAVFLARCQDVSRYASRRHISQPTDLLASFVDSYFHDLRFFTFDKPIQNTNHSDFFHERIFSVRNFAIIFCLFVFSLFVVFKMFKVKLLIWYRRSLYVTGKIFRTGE